MDMTKFETHLIGIDRLGKAATRDQAEPERSVLGIGHRVRRSGRKARGLSQGRPGSAGWQIADFPQRRRRPAAASSGLGRVAGRAVAAGVGIAPGRRGAGMADVVPGFKIPPGFKAIRLKPDDTPLFGWQTEVSEPDDDYRSMGKVARKGYGLVDTDPRNNARIDDELVAKYGEELISGWVERTPGGGFHIPVRLPEDLWDMPQCQNGRDKKQLPSLPYGVDIKVGGKGYGLAAGSQRAKDGAGTWWRRKAR